MLPLGDVEARSMESWWWRQRMQSVESESDGLLVRFASLQPHAGRIITGLTVRASAASCAAALICSNA